ncbi:MAG: phage portal protein [Deltaproteobacteria bacterium]|nr:phage portal protein [Deltaproteobacteria bacterium]
MARSAYLKIVDAKGDPIPAKAYAGPYEGAAYGRRMSTWGTSTAGANTTLFSSLGTLRARSRQLVRNDPLATGGMDTLVANLVGTGITPRWLLKDPDLKAEIQELWADWVLEADADEICDFYGLQSLLTRGIIEGGHMLVRFRPRRPESGFSVPLQLQLLEGDHLDETYNSMAPNGNEIRMGIEINKAGKRAAYWLWKEHPGESFLTSGDHSKRIRVPASEIIHVFRPLRAGQLLGTPWLASVIVTQHETNQFDDAEIVRKKGAAMFGGFITEMPGESVDYPPLGKKTDDDSEGRDVVALEPGTFPVLPTGMDVKFSNPADVGGGYEAFTKRQDRRAARGFGGLTYEKFSGNLEDVNYSSIRAGNLEFQRICKQTIYTVLVFQFCRRVTQRWVDTAVLSRGLIMPDYTSNRRKYHRIKWDIDGWPWVDPLKDVQAEKDAVRSGFKSRSQVVGERGHDSEVVDEEISRDNKRADKHENVYDSDGRMTDKSGKAQQLIDNEE